jgi:hypothetical protein
MGGKYYMFVVQAGARTGVGEKNKKVGVNIPFYSVKIMLTKQCKTPADGPRGGGRLITR